MSSVPEDLIGMWTGQKISEEPPEYERILTFYPDGHYESVIISSEDGGPVGAPSYGIQTHKQEVRGNVIINGPYMILHPTSNIFDKQKIQTDSALEENYVWEIFNQQCDGLQVLKIKGSDSAHFFHRNLNQKN